MSSEYLWAKAGTIACTAVVVSTGRLARPSAMTMSRPLSAVSRVSVTHGVPVMFRSFCVRGMLKTSTSGSCHRNQTGTRWGRPSGRVVPSQMMGSRDRRSEV